MVEKEICLAKCDIYTYNQDVDSDFCREDDSFWSFNYFYNRNPQLSDCDACLVCCLGASFVEPVGWCSGVV